MFNIIENDNNDVCLICFGIPESELLLDINEEGLLVCEECLTNALEQLKEFAINKLAANKARKLLLERGYDPSELDIMTYDEILKLANVDYLNYHADRK